AGPAMDVEILTALFDDYVRAARILGVDAVFATAVDSMKRRFPPLQVGKNGELQEWLNDWVSIEPQHRHLSHLWGLYPGDEILPHGTPEIATAARRSLIARGEGGCGWSIAWKMALWARLGDGERAYASFRTLMSNNVFPDLFSRCGQAMQVDGNFGAAAGIGEMLLQSQTGEIVLLPALPNEWSNGHVNGLRARGGFELDVEWKGGALRKVVIRSLNGNACTVRYSGRSVRFDTKSGESYTLDGELKKS
ncbi:MAG TPA: glycoside hydrolase family 95 protein, partial [Bacteroidota bacterium]|nr:glycoside hydrolase family 95 protein [Bacteroidota bacterium]